MPIHTWNSKAPTRSYLAQLPTLLLPLLSIPQSACNVIPTNLTPAEAHLSLSPVIYLTTSPSYNQTTKKQIPSSLLLIVLVAVHCVAAFLVVPGQPRPTFGPPPTRKPTLQPNNHRACQQSTRVIISYPVLHRQSSTAASTYRASSRSPSLNWKVASSSILCCHDTLAPLVQAPRPTSLIDVDAIPKKPVCTISLLKSRHYRQLKLHRCVCLAQLGPVTRDFRWPFAISHDILASPTSSSTTVFSSSWEASSEHIHSLVYRHFTQVSSDDTIINTPYIAARSIARRALYRSSSTVAFSFVYLTTL